EYNKWLKQNETFSEESELSYNPLISLLIPVYNIGRAYLSECIDSLLNQTYQNFEIILVDDCSTKEETKETLKEYEKKDSRIIVKYRKKNGHISATTNDALKLAKGEFVGLVDNDDTLDKHALYEVVKVLNENKKIDMIYSDEDKINLKGERCDPNFKSDFAPDSLLSSNYICHFTVLRKSIMDKIGGFRIGYEGAQDYDLFLRFTEQTNNIYHIPKILYHWRMVEGSTSMVIDNKSYALEKGKLALEDALKRRKIKGTVNISDNCPYYQIEYEVPKNAKVSIIIPTKDHADITENCLKSIYEKTTYTNFEIILVNNNSSEKDLFDLLEKYKKEHDNFQVVDANFEFNYSKINNLAEKKATGDYILLLNNDVEVITPDWLEKMLGYASQKHIGAVGVKLLYPDETVQHGGVVLGLGGVAAHVFLNSPRDALVWGGRLSVPYNYSAVTAACLLIERKKWNEVKGLEEDLKVAFNDVDFNLKLLKKGYYNVFLPTVELYHHESKSRGLDNTTEKYKRFVSEVNYMTEKWEKELMNDRFYNPNYSLLKDYVLDKKPESRK
ncbi:MAG: glycosyltransferase family 2 protein, partial [Bacilli bacterium]|nr:glycosyltransferase family 2 protein [Bacilli bacterium]